ncbi:hypothetical protein [Larkinella soli]|uniref:hypothetical protein n=1 Tax=Larkinella soli TaxID=1770527 RepID=UPI000FFCB019|nr:hypothetical protein [Larkinella soli]
MDRNALVNAIKDKLSDLNRLHELQHRMPFVDAFVLVKTLTGFFDNVYILGVSSPALKKKLLEEFEVSDKLIDFLSEHLTLEAWSKIDRVRAYPTLT